MSQILECSSSQKRLWTDSKAGLGNIIFGEKRESILQESHEIRFGDDFWWRERRPFISIVLE